MVGYNFRCEDDYFSCWDFDDILAFAYYTVSSDENPISCE